MPRGAPQKHVVCPVDELPSGSRKIVDVGGRSIGVFNVEGRYHAIRNVCPHHGAPLCLGELTGTMLPTPPYQYEWGRDSEILVCPWHGYEFDITTGRTLYDPSDLRVKVYPVSVEDGMVVFEI